MADRLFKSLTKGIVFKQPSVQEDSTPQPECVSIPSSLDTPESVTHFRRQLDIRVYNGGEQLPAPLLSIADAPIPRVLAERVQSLFPSLTPVQRQAIPLMLQQPGRDLFAVAPTGSGKTMAYLIPLLSRLAEKDKDVGKGVKDDGLKKGKRQEAESQQKRPSPRAIIVAPTRELAGQIHREAKRLESPIRVALLNKALLRSWTAHAPSKVPDVLVCAPMRLVQAMKIISVSAVECLILDEADKLLELGFLEQVDSILADLPSAGCRKALFSATIPTGVERIAQSFMINPQRLVVGVANAACANVKQHLVYCGQEAGRLMALRQMLLQQQYQGEAIPVPALIFCETQARVTALHRQLADMQVPHLDYFHADRPQVDRDAVVAGLRSGRLWFVVATDLLARGLDFPSIHTVINYDYPGSCATYIHRCGRTGRAGKSGLAYTLFTDANVPNLPLVANVMMQSGQPVPAWVWAARSKKDLKRQRYVQQAKRLKNSLPSK